MFKTCTFLAVVACLAVLFSALPDATQASSQINPQCTYYFDSINGNDSNQGTTPATAFKSLGVVNTLDLEPGNALCLANGSVFVQNTAPATLTINQQSSGTADQPIVITSYNPGGYVSGLPTIRNLRNFYPTVGVLVHGSNILIENINVDEAGIAGIEIKPETSTSSPPVNVRIERSYISNVYYGIVLSSSGHVIKNNTFERLEGDVTAGGYAIQLNGQNTQSSQITTVITENRCLSCHVDLTLTKIGGLVEINSGANKVEISRNRVDSGNSLVLLQQTQQGAQSLFRDIDIVFNIVSVFDSVIKLNIASDFDPWSSLYVYRNSIHANQTASSVVRTQKTPATSIYPMIFLGNIFSDFGNFYSNPSNQQLPQNANLSTNVFSNDLAGLTATNGNILNAGEVFYNPGGADFFTQPASVSRNTLSPGQNNPKWTTDYFKKTIFLDRQSDAGALEFNGCHEADLNSDNYVDISDYSILIRNFLKNRTEALDPAADLDRSGYIDISDYSFMISWFLKTC